MFDEFEKQKNSYLKAIEQGGKIQHLVSLDEWGFFRGWIESSVQEITERVMRGEFLKNLREEDYNKGLAAGLQMILDGADSFVTKAEVSRRKLKDLEDLDV